MDPRELIGTWHFTRAVEDHHAGTDYSAEGQAHFTVIDPDRIEWAERGTLTWERNSSPFTRTLFIVTDESSTTDASPTWRVLFDDGRDFHPWGQGQVVHPCRADLYRGGIGDLSRPSPEASRTWTITWDVEGPQKDYSMTTTYTEAAG